MTSQLAFSNFLSQNVTNRFRARRARMSLNRVLNSSVLSISLQSPNRSFFSDANIEKHNEFSRRCAPYTKRNKPARPNPLNVRSQSVNHSIATRIQCLALYEDGRSAREAERICGVGGHKPTGQTVQRWKRKAIQLGYDRDKSRIIKAEYVQDRPRKGRSIHVTTEVEKALIADGTYLFK